MKIYLTSLICILFYSFHLFAITIHVPSDYPTIQEGIFAAEAGDTVLVDDGVYTGSGNTWLTFRAKAIVLKSANGPENCVIDLVTGTPEKAFYLYEGETNQTVIDGFTIKNGCWVIYCEFNSSPTIRNNILINNNAGVFCGLGSTAIIENNIITNNYEGGILCQQSAPTIRNNKIQNNSESGIYAFKCNPIIENNIINNNSAENGGGIRLYNSKAIITGNIISGNKADIFGGGIYALDDTSKISNNTIADNSSVSGGGGIYAKGSVEILTNNIIAFSKRLSPAKNTKIERVSGSYTSSVYNYSGGVLSSVTCWQRIQNNGAAGNITVHVPGVSDTTFYINASEKYQLKAVFKIRDSFLVSTVNARIYFDNDTLTIPIGLGAEYTYTISLLASSMGLSPVGGVVAIEGDTDNVINCDFYNNESGEYFTDQYEGDLFDISTVNNNLNSDPQFLGNTFILSNTSPCIDGGLQDTNGLCLPEFDLEGNERIMDGDKNGIPIVDIGACEYNHNTATGTGEEESIVEKLQLFQNYPNPFNPKTIIKFSIINPDKVTLKVYDMLGREVAVLVEDYLYPGVYEKIFNGDKLASGVYIYKLFTQNVLLTKKLILIK